METRDSRSLLTEEKAMRKEHRRIRRGIISVLLALMVMMTTMGAYYVHAVVEEPALLFAPVGRTVAAATAAPTPLFDVGPYLPTANPKTTPMPTPVPQSETPEADPDPLGEGKPLTGIVNIALFGIDALENGGTTSGTMPHTDANMIVAINFDTKEVSLISIARDAFTYAPGHSGFYKFNCIFNVGGGMADPHKGLELSCRTAEMWLGGLSVPYYYGVDFQAMVDLGDALGGIDYDSEIDLYTLDGRTMRRGQQHLDGQGIMAYIRMRHTAGGQDWMRTERQRKMMIALFRKIKEEGKLSLIPEIARTMEQDVYTNLSVAQIAALANFAQDVDPDNVHPYSFHGGMYGQYGWRFCYINQQSRIDILKEVYGIDAKPLGFNSPLYERFLHKQGFPALQHIGYTKQLFNAIHSTASAETMTEEQKKLYAACWQDYMDLQNAFELADQWTQAHYDEKAKVSVEDTKLRTAYYNALPAMEQQLEKSANALNEAFGSPVKLDWKRDVEQYDKEGSVINEVYVDFA